MLGKKIETMYRAQLFARYDDTGSVFYFSAADFEGMRQVPFSFRASAGHRLQGYFYSYDGYKPGRIVVFDHGMGAGHRAYMKEIEMLARHGYLVFSYDHTGCMESEGAHTNGFGQSLRDLNDAISALKADPTWGKCEFSVMGHSWGSISTMNIAALHPDVKHVIGMAGPVSTERILRSMFGKGPMKLFFKRLWKLEQATNGDFVRYDASETLKNTTAQVLLIYSDNDAIVSRAAHFDVLKAALDGRDNVRLLLEHGKGHNPNYTADAVQYKDAFFAELTAKNKAKELETPEQKRAFVEKWDWDRMTVQDERVWQAVFETLEK